MDFEENYEQQIIARVLEDGERNVLVADTVDVADHISFRSLDDDGKNIIEHEFDIDMREDYTGQQLYSEVVKAFESTYDDLETDSAPNVVALD